MPPRRAATARAAVDEAATADLRTDGEIHETERREQPSEDFDSAQDGSARRSDSSIPFKDRNGPNHVRILLATDNHVGYMERDPVRGQDSINTFREILQIAVDRDVDMILLGGDLFHENKPSRSTLHQVMASLRQYCFSDKPVSIELLSDPNDGKAEGYDFPAINYEDPNLNVGIPVFSIHGNHDDPQGVGVEGALSALDVLSVSGLVNYFGKVELPSNDAAAGRSSKTAPDAGGLSDVGIRIRPVLLQKGETKIALYGMGNIKDERMHYELRSNRVRMYRPREDPNSWFNVLVVHQNRAAHDPKACVPETMFDDSVHLVVWGHEHEQLIQPQAVGGKSYHISQPGSSVATSLSAGETTEKCVGIIHVEGTEYYMESISLQTVRPFVMDDMSLDEEMEEAGIEVKDKAGIQKLLRSRVYELIDKANEEWRQRYSDLAETERPPTRLPLVRLRVEYSASLELGNPIRFGQEFIDKVANPKDVLQFSKRRVPRIKGKPGTADQRFAFVDFDEIDVLPADKFEKIKVGGLVKEFLSKQNLELLNSEGLDRAILNFVEKDDRDAIVHFVKDMTKSVQVQLNTLQPDETALNQELDKIRDETHRNHRNQVELSATSEPSSSRVASKAASSRRRADSDDSMLDDMEVDEDDDLFQEESRGASPVKATRGGHRSPAEPPAASRSRSRKEPMFLGGSDDDLNDENESTSPQTTLPHSSRAHVLARGTGKKPAARTTKAAAKSTVTRPTSSRAAAAKATRRVAARAADEDDDSGSDGFAIDEEASQAALRRKR